MSSFPEALSTPDDMGMCPLHHLASAPFEHNDALATLIQCFPEAVSIRDRRGWLPLHIAAACSTEAVATAEGPSERGTEASALEWMASLLDAAPEAVLTADNVRF